MRTAVCSLDVVAPPISSGSCEEVSQEVEKGREGERARLELEALHLTGHKHHLVQRRRNQTRQTNHVGLLGGRRRQDLLTGDHDAQVDDTVAVALQHHTDNVLHRGETMRR
jgi:hypothetical protein